MRVLFQGDSITDGNRYKLEEQRWDLNHQIGHGWQFCVAARLGFEHPGEYEFFNRAISGNTCYELNDRWEEDTIALKPDMLLLLIGTNDASRNARDIGDLTAKPYAEGLSKLIERTQSALPDVKIILLEPFGFRDEEGNHITEILKKEQELIPGIAEKYGCGLIPLQKKFDDAAAINGKKYWMWDGVHPTEAGHGLIAQAVFDYLEKNK